MPDVSAHGAPGHKTVQCLVINAPLPAHSQAGKRTGLEHTPDALGPDAEVLGHLRD
jgi:hypothetical protein